jgi:hypothetical protein
LQQAVDEAVLRAVLLPLHTQKQEVPQCIQLLRTTTKNISNKADIMHC